MPKQYLPDTTATALGGDHRKVVSLVDVFHIIRSHWVAGLLLGALVVGLFVGFVLTRDDFYEAEASLTVELATDNVMNIREVVNTGVTHVNLLNTVMNTHVQRLKGRSLAESVVDSLSEELKIRAVEGYVGPLEERPPEASPPDLAGLILKNSLQVERGGEDDSQVITLIISHADPHVARELANSFIDQYIERKADDRMTSTEEAVGFLGRQVQGMREELRASELAMQAFREKHNLVSVQMEGGTMAERLDRMNTALTDMRIRLMGGESRMKEIEAAGGDLDRLMEISFIGGREDINDIYTQLNELRREGKVLNETYLSRHPKIIQNEASHKAVLEALDRAVEQARQQVVSEYNVIDRERQQLEAKLTETEQEVLASERAMIEYRQMERAIDKDREIFNTLVTRYRETGIAQQMNLNNVRVMDYALLPYSPSSASPVQVMAASIFLAGLFMVGVPLAIELLDTRLKSFADIESFSGKPLLGDVRQIPKKDFVALSKGVLSKDQDMVEAFRSIYVALRMRTNISQQAISFVVTSSLPGEGKSTVASNLASAISKHDYSVLLVDCDLRRPSLHTAFGVENEKGVLTWAEQNKSVEDTRELLLEPSLGIVEISKNLYLLPSGGTTDNSTEFFGDRKMEGFFNQLKEEFDVVILDTPPVGLFADAALVGDYVDECIFVARQFQVTRQKVRHSIGSMDRSRAFVRGVVFNGIKDTTAAVGYGQKHLGSQYGHGFEKNRSKYKEYYSPST